MYLKLKKQNCKMWLWYKRSAGVIAGQDGTSHESQEISLGIWKSYFWANRFSPTKTNLRDVFAHSCHLVKNACTSTAEQPWLVPWLKTPWKCLFNELSGEPGKPSRSNCKSYLADKLKLCLSKQWSQQALNAFRENYKAVKTSVIQNQETYKLHKLLWKLTA